jgi:hypothetical protein
MVSDFHLTLTISPGIVNDIPLKETDFCGRRSTREFPGDNAGEFARNSRCL